MSGLTANIIGRDVFQRFTADGIWVKPYGIKTVVIECIGGGGGGGGGAMARKSFPADSLPSTLDVVVGATASGGAVSGSPTVGAQGNHSQVDIPSGETEAGKVIIIAYGGGGGGHASNNGGRSGSGGGGGGTGGSGAVGASVQPAAADAVCNG